MTGDGAGDSAPFDGRRRERVVRLALLDEAECARAAGQVQALRPHWENRIPGLHFYTLGAASYLDSGPAAKRDAYYRKAAALNPILEREFEWLYDRLLRELGRLLGAPAAFEPRAARPAFHIYLAHRAFSRPLGKVHFDLQYEYLDWSAYDGLDFARPVSFTLALRLPSAGAGLLTWDIAKADYDAMDGSARARLGGQREPRYVAYREGGLICHSGLLLHQIAPARADMLPGDARITLQGHGLPGRDGYWLYW